MAANAQTMISTPNSYQPQTAYSELPYYNTALDTRNSFYQVPNTPGPGHTLNPDYIAAGPNKSLID